MAEQDGFDPYRIWLGIPAAEQPPTYYRLLGLVDYESDPDVISNAADRCMAHVRTFQTGARAELSQRVLNELSIARAYLLDANRRREYDAHLRRQRGAAPPPPPATPLAVSPMAPVPVAAPIAAPVATPVSTPYATPVGVVGATAVAEPAAEVPLVAPRGGASMRQRVRKKSSPLPLLVLLAVGVLAALVGVLIVGRDGEEPAAERAQPAPKPPPRVITLPRTDTPRTTTGGAPVVTVRPSSEMDYQGDGGRRPATVDEALDRAIWEMGRSNVWRAQHLLRIALELNPTAKQSERHAKLSKILEYRMSYQQALDNAVRKLEPGQKIDVEQGRRKISAAFVEAEGQPGQPERLVFESEGNRRIYRVDNLPVAWSVAIARTMLDESSPAARLALATFLAVSRQGDAEQATAMWRDLVAEGIADPSLAKELQLSLGNVTAKRAEMKPDEPRPERPQMDEMPEKSADEAMAERLDTRSPVPANEALLEARRKLREDYRDRISRARSSADKLELAQELLTAAQTAEAGGLQYVLYEAAFQQAVAACSPETFAPIIDELTSKYAADPLELKTQALTDAGPAAASAEQGESIYLYASDAFASAKESRRFDLAEKLARVAVKAAQRAQDRETADEAEVEARKMQTLHQLTTAANAARAALAANETDAAASAALGRFECFVNENWQAGLPLLRRGDDKALAELAAADLAAPADVAARAALAERWLQTARQQRDGAKAAPLHRARHWYEQALEGAGDAEKAAFEKSLQTIDSLLQTAG